ncbi:type II toxin-antitoxin system RelE/ParE family toxin [Pseudomonas entomophila]|uniref:type II toxin-antitoxin system RelE/ParE family toxin n=1 Tax=Pseudomonas entomophila TaxID=312306 RepID=UPI001BD013A0|nr:type II toxin-antitoxin system RelE/ParE family toxin [Pseudomonas entomophila]QVM91815.1 type II toxin-antitoxin system RelE/ParE family toxin [Pseudomonas entomophila]
MSKKKYTVILANTAQFSIENQIQFLAGHAPTEVSQAAAYGHVMPLVDQVVSLLGAAPNAYPVAPELAKLGITKFRRLLVENFRVFYEVNELSLTVTVILFINQRQSVERALVDYAILGSLP